MKKFSAISRFLISGMALIIAGHWAGGELLRADDLPQARQGYAHGHFRNSPGVQATRAFLELTQFLSAHQTRLSSDDKNRYYDALELAQRIVIAECSGQTGAACKALATDSPVYQPSGVDAQAIDAAEKSVAVVADLYAKQWDPDWLKKRFDSMIPMSVGIDEVISRYASYGDRHLAPEYERVAGVRAQKTIPQILPYLRNYDVELSQEEKERYLKALIFMWQVAEKDCFRGTDKELQCIKALRHGIDTVSARASDVDAAKRLAEEGLVEARALRYTAAGALVMAQQAAETLMGKFVGK